MTDRGEEKQAPRQAFYPVHRWRWRALAIWCVLFTVAGVLLAHQHRGLISDNKATLVAIQQSRVESCKDNYDGIVKAFKPFFTAPGMETPEQKANLTKFKRNIRALKRQCAEQVKTKGVSG